MSVDLTTAPPAYSYWPELAAEALRLRETRAAADPAAVERGRLTEAAAADRLRIATAIAAIWTAVIQNRDLPDPHARWHETEGREGARVDEMIATLTAAAAMIANRAAADPSDGTLAACGEAFAALLWWQHPAISGGTTPRIVSVHRLNQAIRADLAEPRKEAA